MKHNDKNLKDFIKKVENKFEKYFVAYSIKKYKEVHNINVIIDDRDVLKMEKKDLIIRLNNNLQKLLKKDSKKIKAKSILVSDINESNIWNVLMGYAVIFNIKALSSFINVKVPSNFLGVYKKLSKKFKLSDFEREISRISKKNYHRNTYQNWLKSLKNAGFLKLKNKTYHKIEEPYKKSLLNDLKK